MQNVSTLKKHSARFYIAMLTILLISTTAIFGQQIDLPRVELMPNMPQPYDMRNWKEVAIGYDAFVFDISKSGQYLPLVRFETHPLNYPSHWSFWLHTAVGTNSPLNGEAINVLPAVVSATLVDIDKSNQSGFNWVLWCEEFFNKRPEENVYLNNTVTSSGSDWWYDTMPNVFFYQLYYFYPGTGDFDFQFTSIADRWLEAVETMGGDTAPWDVPNMNHRAWRLATMTPNNSGVRQPEAAGALAWLLYNAYTVTQIEKYRIGAEWCMEFLHNWTTNPSYELQLPYGVHVAARMNAELGTDYDIEKFLNWCFNPEDNVRNWGATLGNWGGYDCYGLIGEAKYDGYPFIMNGFEMAGALVPMVRYDDRFARAIGKWLLNCANASRLFYSKYLPDQNQDSEGWSKVYDPDSYIAYEAMRESNLGYSPFATGDWLKGNWGATNLALYGSSHVGIFGGIIDTTNIEMILQLDLLKTDYYHDEAYPSYLYFNPYDETKTVEIDVGGETCDLYDAVSNTFLQTGVSGLTSFQIPADAAALVVLTPAGGVTAYDLDKLFINDVVVDYSSAQAAANYPPRIKSLASEDDNVPLNGQLTIYCTASDKDGDNLQYNWNSVSGTFTGEGATVEWTAPGTAGTVTIQCIVSDGLGGQDSSEVAIEVLSNYPPIIESMSVDPDRLDAGATTTVTCTASDPDGDTVFYTWSSVAGSFEGEGATVTWTAPDVQGFYFLRCDVDDQNGGITSDSVRVIVQNTENPGTGLPIAYYPFNGNANDESGSDNHGTTYGPTLAADRLGNEDSAYRFDGVNDYIYVTNNDMLNFQDEISVSFWVKPEKYYERESYILSHGNWENRWKISLNQGDNHLRWTVKTENGTKDADSSTELALNTWYNITTLYDGSSFDIYVNGTLETHDVMTGKILQTTIDMTFGQVLPNNTCCNFNGVIDDIRIYDYALTLTEIQNIYNEFSPVLEEKNIETPLDYVMVRNYPNPFNNTTTIYYTVPRSKTNITVPVKLIIYNSLGAQVCQLFDHRQEPGAYTHTWNGEDDAHTPLPSGVYLGYLQVGGEKHCCKFLLVR